MHIRITIDDDILQRFGNQLGAVGEKEGHKALARAVNRVTNTVHGRVIGAVAKQSSIPKRIVAGTVKKRLVKPGSGAALEGEVWATGKPLSLKVFGAKQFSWGVRAKVWGQFQRYPGWFIYGGHYRSGKPVGSGHVFARLSSKSHPIELKDGPSVPEELIRGESERIFHRTVQDMLPRRVAHELGRILHID